MNYKKYIELGFIRTDMCDKLEFENTGYNGYILTKAVNENMYICVSGGQLENPVLMISKAGREKYHRIKITTEMVKDILTDVVGAIQEHQMSECFRKTIENIQI